MLLKIREELILYSEEGYKEFIKKLIPGNDNILGVRMKNLRKIAAKIFKEYNWEDYILSENIMYYEENIIQGLLIGKIKKDLEKVFKLSENFIPKINNWAICDSFCSELKITMEHKKEMWEFIQNYFLSSKEYDNRFALVISLKYFLEKEYIEKLFFILDNLKTKYYYVKMAEAWLLAELFIKFPYETYVYMSNNNLDKFTYNKAVQKICDSLRVSLNEKEKIKKIRRD